MLAYRHFSGASEKRVIAATRTIEAAGSARQLTRELAARNTTFMDLEHKSGRTSAIALEIALNDETERQLLELELKELEARWREEEDIAAIIDGELTPAPSLDRLRTATALDNTTLPLRSNPSHE
jgi:hypothetical protein